MRNTVWPISSPATTVGRKCRIASSIATRAPLLPTSMNRGRSSGTLTRMNRGCSLDAVGGDDADVQGERRQKRERGGRADRDRCQERLDLAPEALRQRSQLAARALLHRDDADALRGERGTQLVEPERFLRLLQGARPRAHIRQCPSGRPSVGRAPSDGGLDLREQAGDTHRVELVEVRGDDPAELHALEQRHVLVRRDLEHALVEIEPRELAVEEARGPLGGIARDGARARRLGCHRNDYGRSSSSRLTPCSVLAMCLPSLKPAGAARQGAALCPQCARSPSEVGWASSSGDEPTLRSYAGEMTRLGQHEAMRTRPH